MKKGKGGPGGLRRSDALVRGRRQLVEQWMHEGKGRAEVLELAEVHCPGVPSRTLDADMAAILTRWTEADAISYPERRAAALARLRDHIAEARLDRHWPGVAALEKLVRQIEGTLVSSPTVAVQINEAVTAAAQPCPVCSTRNLRRLSDAEFDAHEALDTLARGELVEPVRAAAAAEKLAEEWRGKLPRALPPPG